MSRHSWLAELNRKYRKILSPKYTSADLDKANEAILETIAKLDKILKVKS